MNYIDFRSDTVTKPTPAMLEAMQLAEVGDDVYGEDPTVNRLQEAAAQLFGMEAALFCPSGTMTNQIALRVLTQPQDEVICDRMSHIYNYEGGGIAYNSLISARLVHTPNGMLSAADVLDNLNPDDIHFPKTTLVALENTVNKGGGNCYRVADIRPIAEVCRQRGLHLHLDGARLFNALVATSDQARDYGPLFDTISICLSKGLGAPVGSLLLGSSSTVARALRVRKVLGGGMRQAGYLAAAGLHALTHHVARLADDHARARALADCLAAQPYVVEVVPVYTNIVIFKLLPTLDPAQFSQRLKSAGILANPFGKGAIRLVTHLDIDDGKLEQAINIFQRLGQQ
jgi:threonine aldolase